MLIHKFLDLCFSPVHCLSFPCSPGIEAKDVVYPQIVQQVSLVPTVALLMGVPIPFSSVGSVVPELFGSKQLAALRVNVRQVHRYLALYEEKFANNKFPKKMWKDLLSLKSDIEILQTKSLDDKDNAEKYNIFIERSNIDIDNQDLKKIDDEQISRLERKLLLEYLTLAKVMCEEVWATFDVREMLSGIILMFVALCNVFAIVLSLNKHEDTHLYFVKGNCILIVIILLTLALKHFILVPVVRFLPALFGGVVVMFHCSKISNLSVFAASKDMFPLLMFLFICCGNLSNSYVVHEDSVVAFSLISLITFLALRALFVHKNITFANGKIVNLERISLILGIVAVTACVCSCVAVRVGQGYYRCREEQHNCVQSNTFQPLSSIDTSLQNSRYFTGLFVLALLAYVPRSWFSYCGNLNGTRLSVFVVRYSGVFCALMTGAYWAMEAVPKPTELTKSYLNYPPRAVYLVASLAVLLIFMKPLLIFHFKKKERRQLQTSNPKEIIPELFQNLKAEYSQEQQTPDTPVVFGLATGVSAPIVGVCCLMLGVVTLLVGDGTAPSIVALVVTALGWLVLHSINCWTNSALGQYYYTMSSAAL